MSVRMLTLRFAVQSLPRARCRRYGLIFALLVKYYHDVPTAYTMQFMNLPLSNKVLVYLIAAQVSKQNESDCASACRGPAAHA